MMRPTIVAACGLLAATPAARAQDCNAAAPDPVVHLSLPGGPFTPVPTQDGCWVFVPLGGGNGGTAGVAVVRRGGGRLTLERVVPLKANGTGAALSRDGRTLIVAAAASVAFLDAARLQSGVGNPLLGYLDVEEGAGVIHVGTTPDDAMLFVALERAAAILVADFAKIRSGDFAAAVLGRVPVGRSPIAVTTSADGRLLYTTSQAALPDWGWPVECRPEANPGAAPDHPRGGVVVIDIARARIDPARAVVARIPVGCNPVRLALTPDERTMWVSTRGDHAIVALDVRRLLDDPDHAVLARVKVGTAPVGVAVIDGGRTVIATNSNRFAGGADDRQSLNVVDASAGPAAAKLLGAIPAGAFPRELRVSADGHTLFASNFGSRTLQVVDLHRLADAMKP